MNQKRKYIIENLFVDNFVESESRAIYLEEKEDSGRSLLEMQLNTDGNLSIKNVDMKNTHMHYFKNDKILSMNKRVDHIIFEYVSENDWKLAFNRDEIFSWKKQMERNKRKIQSKLFAGTGNSCDVRAEYCKCTYVYFV